MTPQYRRVEGVLAEPVGLLWAVYSPASGETALLNDESVAILEVLAAGPGDAKTVSATLSEGDRDDAVSIASVIEASWPRLIGAGLVREVRPAPNMPR